MTALGASIGTGNIAGVATAVVTGGPGAVFWIWVYGFFATAIKFTEAVLGIRYRAARRGPALRGPDALPARRAEAARGWRGSTRWSPASRRSPPRPFTQPNSMAVVLQSVFGIPHLGVGRRHRRAGLARDHRRHQVDRPRRREAAPAQGGPLPGRRADRDRDARWASCPRCCPLIVREALLDRRGHGRHRGRRHDGRDALRHRARRLRERGGLRHGGRRLRHRAQRRSRCSRA